MIRDSHAITSGISLSVELLRAGKLVAFPTETVYGLGCDATNPAAIQALYSAKGRPTDHPVIVHLYDVEQIGDWAINVPSIAYDLAAQFWPGPLTILLQRAPGVLDQITGGQNTVGLRIPRHPLALELLAAFGRGVAAPSANKFGRLSPTCAQDVRREFGAEVDLVLDGGPCAVGIESTIIDLSCGSPRILRPGVIDRTALSGILSQSVGSEPSRPALRVSGSLPSHYAPHTPLDLVQPDELDLFLERLRLANIKTAVLAFKKPRADVPMIVAPSDPNDYARALYLNLRRLDDLNLDRIVVENLPQIAAWEAIRDRLSRAAASRPIE